MKKHKVVKLLALWATVLCFSSMVSCDYARMRDQESVRTYKKRMPEMDQRTIPIDGGFQVLALADPRTLTNPVPPTASSLDRGRRAYGYFCIHCHGPRADGMGTVGQSFFPLPADLASARVQSLGDGELYVRIRLGYKRHPQLFATVSEGDTWALVIYLRSLKAGG